MANNFDGLGFGFEVSDDGANESVETLTGSVNDLWEDLKKIGSGIPKVTQGIGRGIRSFGAKGARSVGMVTTALGGMVDKAMSPELDAPYAQMYAEFNKNFSKMTAGMEDTTGRLEKARKKIGGTAHGMGEDMNAAAEGFVAFEKQGVDLEKILGTKGLEGTIKGLIKSMSVFDLQGKDLAQMAGSLKKGFGFAEEQIGQLLDEMIYIGKPFNMGTEMIQGMQGALESANKDLADFGKQATPENIRKYMLDIAQLGVTYKEALGLQGAQAIEAARESMSVFMQERKNIQNMMRGMEGEFGPLIKGLLEAGDNSDEVFKRIVEGDPVEFLRMMNQISDQAKTMGGETGIAFQRLKGVLNETMGPDTTYLVTGNLSAIQEKLGGVMGSLSKAEGAFKKTSDQSWKSSITMGEAWEMMVSNMQAKVFRLSNREIRAWQKDMRKGFKRTFGVIEAAASDDGPLGDLTRRLLAVKRVGLTALIPGLGSLGPIIGGVTTDMLPMLTALGSMGIRFSDLGKMAIGGGALFTVFKLLKDGPGGVLSGIEKMGDGIFNVLTKKVFPKKKDIEKNAPHNAMRDLMLGMQKDLNEKGLFDTFKKYLTDRSWFDTVKDYLNIDKYVGRARSMLSALGDFVYDIDWKGVSDKIFTGIEKVVAYIPWEDIGNSILKTAGRILTAVGEGIFGLISDGFRGEYEKGSLEDIIIRAFDSVVDIVKKTAKGALSGLWDSVFNPDSFDDTAKNILKIATGLFAGLIILSKTFRKKAAGAGAGFLKGMFMGRGTGGAVDAYGAGLPGMLPGLDPRGSGGPFQSGRPGLSRGYVMGPVGPVPRGGLAGGGGMGLRGPEGVRPITDGNKRGGVFTRAGRRIGGAVKGIGGVATGAGRRVGGAVKGMGVGGAAGGMLLMGAVFEGVQQLGERTKKMNEITLSKILSDEEKFLLKHEEGFLGVAHTIDGMFMGLPGKIGEALGLSEEDLTGFYHHMVASFEAGIHTAVELFSFLGSSAKKIYLKMTAEGELLIAELVHGYDTAKNSILGTLYNIAEKAETIGHGMIDSLMYPFDYLEFHLKGWMSDFIDLILGDVGSAREEFAKQFLGEDIVKGFRKTASQMKKEQREYLGEHDTWAEAREAHYENERKLIADRHKEKRDALKAEQDQSDQLLKHVEDKTKKAREAGTSEALGRAFERTKKSISDKWDDVSATAEKRAFDTTMARQDMEEEKRRKEEKETRKKRVKTSEDEEKKRRGKEREKTRGKKKKDPISKKEKEDIFTIPSMEERVKAASVSPLASALDKMTKSNEELVALVKENSRLRKNIKPRDIVVKTNSREIGRARDDTDARAAGMNIL